MKDRAHVFATPDALAEALAARVAAALRDRIGETGAASLVVSGGRTPARFLAALSRQKLDWARVWITLADERWVDETSPRSNARLVRETLLQGPAAAACFTPLHRPGETLESALAAIEADLAAMPAPFTIVVLGMGEDGHTASLFPGGDRLGEALDPNCAHLVLPMRAPGADEPRITLTLPAIARADLLILHIEGAAKFAALSRAHANETAATTPIGAILHARPDIEVWRTA